MLVRSRSDRKQKWFWIGLFSLAIHVFVILPYGVARLLTVADPLPPDLEPRQPEELVFIDPNLALPYPESSLPESPKLPDLRLVQVFPEQPKPLYPEPQKLLPPKEPSKPEPKKDPEPKKPLTPVEVEPLPEKLPDLHEKMVSQDQFPEEKDNKEAKFLAEKNHRTKKDRQAKKTNLEKRQSGAESSSRNESTEKDRGDREKVIAELTKPEKQAQTNQPKKEPRLPPVRQPAKQTEKTPARAARQPGTKQGVPNFLPSQSVFAMRTADPKNSNPGAHDPRPGPFPAIPGSSPGIEPSSLKPGIGSEPTSANQGKPGQPAAGPLGGSSVTAERIAQNPFTLPGNSYEAIVGTEQFQAQQKVARNFKPSAAPGHWDRFEKKQAAMKSELENFTPGIELGTESELSTRAHPFAKYIASIHRQIHKKWAFQFLAMLDRQGGGDVPMTAHAKVLIVLNEDGTLCKHKLEQRSGNSSFDATAWDIVDVVSPFRAPPKELRSPNGKTYITWSFFRDNRQCATNFVEPHIVNKGEEICTTPPKKPMSQWKQEDEKKTDKELENYTPGFSF